MKKLLLVLMVVALASFLFVGCVPTVVDDGDDVVDDGTVVVSACPTVSVTTEVEISSKKYIKGGSQTITVTFAEATDPVSVFVGETIKANPAGVPDEAVEVVMYADADKKVYTGKYAFGDSTSDCSEGYIYIATCVTCAPCKVAYTVDEAGPCSQVEIREYPETGCSCGGINLQFRTPVAASSCDTYGCCGDYCTGLDTYKFDLYKADPFGSCCDVPCLSPIASCEGTGCDLDCTISCFDISDYYTNTTAEDFYLVTTLADKVGNKTYYYAILNIDTDEIVSITEYVDDQGAGSCTGWTAGELVGTSGTIGACAVGSSGVCGTVSVPL